MTKPTYSSHWAGGGKTSEQMDMNTSKDTPDNRIVVIGAGFGGMAVVRSLRGAAAQVTLIDRTNHHLFQPLLYQAATASLSPANIATTTRAMLRGQANASVIMADVTGVDVARKRVRLDGSEELQYDHLVIATGADYSFFGHDEWAEHCCVLKTLDDAREIRSRLLGAFEQAERCASSGSGDVQRLLTFAVVGGGPTGVELAGNIADLARSTLSRNFRNIDPASARVMLIEAAPKLLAAFPDRLSRYSERALASLGVEVRLGCQVTQVDARGLTAGGERYETANIFWAAGTKARPAAEWIGAEAARNGAVKVNPDCSVPGVDGVYVIGDASSHPGADGRPLPGLAAVAKQQGHYVGKLLKARLRGRSAPPAFKYVNLGTMAMIGRYRAIAHFPLMKVLGFPAWLLWGLVHLMLLTDMRSRVSVYFNWCTVVFAHSRGARLLTRIPESIRRLRTPVEAPQARSPDQPGSAAGAQHG